MKSQVVLWMSLLLMLSFAHASNTTVRIKDLIHVQSDRENALIGYGLVVGLARTGDSERNSVTRQALINTLKNFNVNLDENNLNSRNTAAVIVTAKLPVFSEVGDQLDVEVSSIGDARSLVGGTLILTPLYAPDRKLYALAQGPIAVGGYNFELNNNVVQKNHSTVGRIPKGANVEQATPMDSHLTQLVLILEQPDYTTASRIAQAITSKTGITGIEVAHAGKIVIPIGSQHQLPLLMAGIENIQVEPDYQARIVINERTGTIVAGADVRIGKVSISQGDLNVTIDTTYQVSQPLAFGRLSSSTISTAVVPETKLKVQEANTGAVNLSHGASVGELVQALQRVKLSTRDIITVIQAIKNAGALHADLIIQ